MRPYLTKAELIAAMQHLNDDATITIGLSAAAISDLYVCNTVDLCEIVVKEARIIDGYVMLLPYDDPLSGIGGDSE